MYDIEINLMENTIYEVIITSFNKQVNFKPFGIKFNNKKVILNLYPNRTLKNIKTSQTIFNEYIDRQKKQLKQLAAKVVMGDTDESI